MLSASSNKSLRASNTVTADASLIEISSSKTFFLTIIIM